MEAKIIDFDSGFKYKTPITYNNDSSSYMEHCLKQMYNEDFNGMCVYFGYNLSETSVLLLAEVEFIPLNLLCSDFDEVLILQHYYDYTDFDNNFDVKKVTLRPNKVVPLDDIDDIDGYLYEVLDDSIYEYIQKSISTVNTDGDYLDKNATLSIIARCREV